MTNDHNLDPGRLAVAAHELAHLYVFRDAGITVSDIKVYGHGHRAAGHVRVDQTMLDGTEMRGLLLGALAGREGDLRWCEEQGMPYRSERTCADDMALYHHHYRKMRKLRHELRIKGITDSALRADARRAVRRHWPQIVRLAPKLARRGAL